MTLNSIPDTDLAKESANAALLEGVRAVQRTGRTRSLEWRLSQLDGIERMLTEAEPQIAAALEQDLGRPAVEAWLGDIASTVGEVRFTRKHLRRWMRPKRIAVGLKQFPGAGRVEYEPLGVALIIGPWNYPVYLTLAPLVAAVSAGNCAVLKPSELAPATSKLLAELVETYLDTDAIKVIEGAADATQELLGLGFDHVVFTGGTEIGRKIMQGAAQTLTPVTLELGGKSPVIVAADADLEVTARRIAWVKSLNSGQTCIAPDYVLVDEQVKDDLVALIADKLREFREGQPSGQRIVNQQQFQRLASYIEMSKGSIVTGGRCDATELSIEPTIIVDPDPDEPCMSEEIFGPILPVRSFRRLDDAIDFVRGREKPLAVYVFSKDKAVQRRVVQEIPAGGAVVNHVAMHCLVPQLPFGGVGASGIGAYHGWWGFEALSHRKAVLTKSFRFDLQLIYPPYSPRALRIMRRFF